MDINIQELAKTTLELVSNNWALTVLVIIVLQTFSAAFFLPTSYIAVLCGVFLGTFSGGCIAVLATCIAIITTTFLGSNIKRLKYVKSMIEKKKSIIDKFLGHSVEDGWRDVFLFFLNPILPGSSMGYFFGLNGVSSKTFFLKIFIASIPLSFLYSSLGSGTINLLYYSHAYYQYLHGVLLVIICIFLIKIVPYIYKKLESFIRK